MLPDWYRHSASSGNLFRECPSAFVWRYALGKREDAQAKPTAGKVVEAALALVLINGASEQDAIATALSDFDAALQGVVSQERDDLPALIRQGLEAMRSLDAKPILYQARLNLQAGERFGFKYPVVGYTDFNFGEAGDVDLKVTWRMPSTPKFSHVAQLGTYSHLQHGRAQRLAYVTPKKWSVHPISAEDLEFGWKTMFATWRRIEAMAELCPTADAALRAVPLDPDSFYWSDPIAKQEAIIAWNL